MNHNTLLALLDHLDSDPGCGIHTWCEWSIMPITGGLNNLLYRVTSPEGDLAVKFTIRDDRNRAGREFDALCALQQAHLEVAPEPIWRDQNSYRQPVVVQAWLDGEVLKEPPRTRTDWEALLDHYCAIHSLTPSRASRPLPEAVFNVASGEAGKAVVYEHHRRLPPEEQPSSLQALLHWFEDWVPPHWPTPPRTLCRTDPNWRNFIRGEHGWWSVDWENSGWGDPAFEIADLIVHPGYADVADAPWDWLIAAYSERMEDDTARLRINTYYTILLMWWVVRCARYLYEVPRGLDKRLVRQSDNWQAQTEQKYESYVSRLEQHITQLQEHRPA